MSNPIFILTVEAAGQDTETAIFATQAQAEQAAIAAVDPYERGEFERAAGQAGSVVFLTLEDAEDEAEARITPADPTPLQIAQLQTGRTEVLTYSELRGAISDARKLLDETEAWADAWHEGGKATAPFHIGGTYQAKPLVEVGLRAQAYRAAAETKAVVAD